MATDNAAAPGLLAGRWLARRDGDLWAECGNFRARITTQPSAIGGISYVAWAGKPGDMKFKGMFFDFEFHRAQAACEAAYAEYRQRVRAECEACGFEVRERAEFPDAP